MMEFLKSYLEQFLAVWSGAVELFAAKLALGIEWLVTNFSPPDFGPGYTLVDWTKTDEFSGWVSLLSVLLLLLFFLIFARMFKRSRPSDDLASLSVLTRRPRIIGYLAVLTLVAFFGGWSAMAPLASASLAPGVISPEGSRKTVAHLEGGIVRAINVREGDLVESGQILLTLEDIQAKSQYSELRKSYLHLLATEARLLAEKSRQSTITFPNELTEATDEEAHRAASVQLDLLGSRRDTQAGREQILLKRVEQLVEQNSGLSDVVATTRGKSKLLDEEIKIVQELYEKRLALYPHLLSLQRARVEIEIDQASHRAKIAENMIRISETEAQLLTIRDQIVEQANDELADVQRQLAEIRSRMSSRADILERTAIRAPLAGTVMNIRPTTESGVIRPGEPILEIVPIHSKLVVDAKVKPSDIDRVWSGMKARVVLSAYSQRNLPLIHGTLRTVSADRMIEDHSGQPYFLAKVDVHIDDLADLHDVKLLPGMPAEVMLLDEEQTFLEYLFNPVFQSVSRSFRQN